MLMKKVLASSLLVVMAIAAAYWVATPSFGRVAAHLAALRLLNIRKQPKSRTHAAFWAQAVEARL